MEQLIFTEDRRSVTSDGMIGVVMLAVSGEGNDADGIEIKWFDYVAGYFHPTTRIEWNKDTMSVVLPPEVANYLIRNGWARPMTGSEVQAYNRGPANEKETANDQGNLRQPVRSEPGSDDGNPAVLPVPVSSGKHSRRGNQPLRDASA